MLLRILGPLLLLNLILGQRLGRRLDSVAQAYRGITHSDLLMQICRRLVSIGYTHIRVYADDLGSLFSFRRPVSNQPLPGSRRQDFKMHPLARRQGVGLSLWFGFADGHV